LLKKKENSRGFPLYLSPSCGLIGGEMNEQKSKATKLKELLIFLIVLPFLVYGLSKYPLNAGDWSE